MCSRNIKSAKNRFYYECKLQSVVSVSVLGRNGMGRDLHLFITSKHNASRWLQMTKQNGNFFVRYLGNAQVRTVQIAINDDNGSPQMRLMMVQHLLPVIHWYISIINVTHTPSEQSHVLSLAMRGSVGGGRHQRHITIFIYIREYVRWRYLAGCARNTRVCIFIISFYLEHRWGINKWANTTRMIFYSSSELIW